MQFNTLVLGVGEKQVYTKEIRNLSTYRYKNIYKAKQKIALRLQIINTIF